MTATLAVNGTLPQRQILPAKTSTANALQGESFELACNEMQILAPTQRSQMECYRKSAHDRYGERYHSRIDPFKSLLVQHFKRYAGQKDIEDIARDFIAILKGQPKFQGKMQNMRAVIFSAALDAEEEGLIHARSSSE
jgi:hypothetical protein